MVNLKTETKIHHDFMDYLNRKKIKANFCKLHSTGRTFEICIRKENILTDKNMEDLSFLLKIRINLAKKQIAYKIYEQKVRLNDNKEVHQYLFACFFYLGNIKMTFVFNPPIIENKLFI